MERIQLIYGLLKEPIAAIMMLYKNTKAMVRSPYGNTDFFDKIATILAGDTLSPYLFQDYERQWDK